MGDLIKVDFSKQESQHINGTDDTNNYYFEEIAGSPSYVPRVVTITAFCVIVICLSLLIL